MRPAKTAPIRLPMKDGVTPSKAAMPDGAWETVEDFLAERLPALTREAWRRRMASGLVIREDGSPIPPGTPYRAGGKLYYYRHLDHEPEIPFFETVIFRDDYLVCADKPHFLPVIPTGKYVRESLLVRLRKKLGIETLSPVHRIDRETAGLVIFSVRPEDRGAYQKLFRERSVYKHYEAAAPFKEELAFPMKYKSRLVQSANFMQMETAEGRPNAETEISVMKREGPFALYRLKPFTGRKHQLRAQMAALGIPIAGDRIYPVHFPEAVTEEMRKAEYRQPLQLVAKEIRFIDPITGELRHFESHFAADLDEAGRWPPDPAEEE